MRVPTGPRRAAALLERGCDGGDAGACGQLGALLVHPPRGLAGNSGRGFEYLTRACDASQGDACHELARIEGARDADVRDGARISKLLERACDTGVGDACSELGSRYQSNQQGVDWYAARRNFQRACDLGSSAGCTHLAEFYVRGVGELATNSPAHNESMALKLFESTCARDYEPACVGLGMVFMASRTQGVADPARAQQLFSHACDAGVVDGCLQLASLLDNGDAGLVDDTAAATMYARLCTEGSATACRRYAVMLADGEGVRQNESQAMRMLSKACKLGEAMSCQVLDERRAKAESEREKRRRADEEKSRHASFRAGLRRGTRSQCGLVIEVNKPVASVQTAQGLIWFEVAELSPPGDGTCTFPGSTP